MLRRPFAAVSDALVPTGGEPGVAICTAIASLKVMVSLSPGLTRPRLVTFGPATTVVCRPSGVLSTTSRVVMSTETTVATNCSVWATAVGVGGGGVWQALRALNIPTPRAEQPGRKVARRNILGPLVLLFCQAA